jgi:hypothetical protein
MGELAVFSGAVSITIACREVADPTYRSLSVQISEASIIAAFRDQTAFQHLSPVIGHRLGMNEDPKQFRGIVFEADLERGLDVVHV